VQDKTIDSIFNETIAENSPNLKKQMGIQVQEAVSTPNTNEQNRTSSCHIIVKMLGIQNNERVLKAAREKYKQRQNPSQL
jgi:hypothetical protein